MPTRRPATRSRRTGRSAPAPRKAARSRAAAPDGDSARRPAAASGLAPGMQRVNTYLAVANITASIDFFERAFGFTRGVTLADPDGQLRYAEVRHGDSVVMLVRKGDSATPTGGAPGLYTYIEDVDQAVAGARAAGARVQEAADQPWGDRVAEVTDPDGYRWVLATFKKLAAFSS